ncbi:MAG: hypothetical protein L0Y67_01665, partial [Gammaproteobacteria bacterium]|nr:hypothetical protein [Gammaproteobacteria bacterium]
GATATADPGGIKATTPGELILKRGEGPYRVTFKLDGYEPYSVMLTTESNGWYWGNLLLGGMIGMAVDSSTGAAYRLSPDEVKANLVKSGIEPQSSSEYFTSYSIDAVSERATTGQDSPRY